jgi:prevent-host-death family protein
MKTVPLTKAKDDLSAVIREAEKEGVVITRHGRPAAVLIGFESEHDWLEYRLLHDEEFLRTIDKARADIKKGKFRKLEDLSD